MTCLTAAIIAALIAWGAAILGLLFGAMMCAAGRADDHNREQEG